MCHSFFVLHLYCKSITKKRAMELKNAVLLLFFLLFLWWMYQKGEIAQK